MEDKARPGQAFDPVTEADRGAEAEIRARLIAARFPEHGVIGEEYGEGPRRRRVRLGSRPHRRHSRLRGGPAGLGLILIGLRSRAAPWIGLDRPALSRRGLSSAQPLGSRLIRSGAGPDARQGAPLPLPDRARCIGHHRPGPVTTGAELAAWTQVRAAARLCPPGPRRLRLRHGRRRNHGPGAGGRTEALGHRGRHPPDRGRRRPGHRLAGGAGGPRRRPGRHRRERPRPVSTTRWWRSGGRRPRAAGSSNFETTRAANPSNCPHARTPPAPGWSPSGSRGTSRRSSRKLAARRLGGERFGPLALSTSRSSSARRRPGQGQAHRRPAPAAPPLSGSERAAGRSRASPR